MELLLVMVVFEAVEDDLWDRDEMDHSEQEVQHHALVPQIWGVGCSLILSPWFPKPLVAYSVWT